MTITLIRYSLILFNKAENAWQQSKQAKPQALIGEYYDPARTRSSRVLRHSPAEMTEIKVLTVEANDNEKFPDIAYRAADEDQKYSLYLNRFLTSESGLNLWKRHYKDDESKLIAACIGLENICFLIGGHGSFADPSYIFAGNPGGHRGGASPFKIHRDDIVQFIRDSIQPAQKTSEENLLKIRFRACSLAASDINVFADFHSPMFLRSSFIHSFGERVYQVSYAPLKMKIPCEVIGEFYNTSSRKIKGKSGARLSWTWSRTATECMDLMKEIVQSGIYYRISDYNQNWQHSLKLKELISRENRDAVTLQYTPHNEGFLVFSKNEQGIITNFGSPAQHFSAFTFFHNHIVRPIWVKLKEIHIKHKDWLLVAHFTAIHLLDENRVLLTIGTNSQLNEAVRHIRILSSILRPLNRYGLQMSDHIRNVIAHSFRDPSFQREEEEIKQEIRKEESKIDEEIQYAEYLRKRSGEEEF